MRLVRTAQQCSRLAHGQFAAQRQCQRLEQCCKARAFARPGHAQLRGLAAPRARHARHIGMQPGLELEEVQVSPGAAQPVVYALPRSVAVRAVEQLGVAAHLEVDAPSGRVQFHLCHFPGRCQSQRTGEQRFNSNAHACLPSQSMQTLCGHVDKPLARLAHIPTQPYYQALLSMLVSTRNDEGPSWLYAVSCGT